MRIKNIWTLWNSGHRNTRSRCDDILDWELKSDVFCRRERGGTHHPHYSVPLLLCATAADDHSESTPAPKQQLADSQEGKMLDHIQILFPYWTFLLHVNACLKFPSVSFFFHFLNVLMVYVDGIQHSVIFAEWRTSAAIVISNLLERNCVGKLTLK